MLNAFQSIRVWLFEAPVERVADLRKRLTIELTSATFREQVRALRASLSQQLADGTVLAGAVMTGRHLDGMVRQCVATLNRGEAVLPSSAYLAMIRQELAVCKDGYLKRFQAALDSFVTSFKHQKLDLFPTNDELQAGITRAVEEVITSYREELMRTG